MWIVVGLCVTCTFGLVIGLDGSGSVKDGVGECVAKCCQSRDLGEHWCRKHDGTYSSSAIDAIKKIIYRVKNLAMNSCDFDFFLAIVVQWRIGIWIGIYTTWSIIRVFPSLRDTITPP